MKHERKADAEATGEMLDNFIQTLQGIGDVVMAFDDSLWASLVESVTVYGKEEATFLFKGGTEIKIGKEKNGRGNRQPLSVFYYFSLVSIIPPA